MELGKCCNFDLRIDRAGGQYRAHLIESPGGETTIGFEPPFAAGEVRDLWQLLHPSGFADTRPESREFGDITRKMVDTAKEYGGRLFSAVFRDELLACYRSSDALVRQQENARLRIRLRFADVPEIADLPWEFLYYPAQDRFLSLSSRTPIIRYLELPQPVRPLEVRLPLRVLVVISSPSDHPPLDSEKEWDLIQTATADLKTRGEIELERLSTPTLEEIGRAVHRKDFHILHFIGHGEHDRASGAGRLLFESESSASRPVTGEQLGVFLQDNSHLGLAVLNACESMRSSATDHFSGVAQQLLRKGLQAVLGFQSQVSEVAAMAFTRNFYSALCEGLPVDFAVSESRRMMFDRCAAPEWGCIALHMRSPDGILFPKIEAAPPLETEIPSAATAHYQRGLKYYAGFTESDMDWAEEEFHKALGVFPRYARAYAGLADVEVFRYMSFFDRSETALLKAEAYGHRALEYDPLCPEAYRALGRAAMSRKDFALARKNFERAIELNPRFLAALVALGWCGVEEHELRRAERTARAALAMEEDNLEVLSLLARIYYYMKEFRTSAATAERALDIDRRAGRAYYDLAMAQRALGQFAEARSNFQGSVKYQGDPNTSVDLGVLSLMEKDYSDALEDFEHARTDNPFRFLASYYSGLTRHLTGRAEEAQRDFEDSLKASRELATLSPRDPYPHAIAAMARGGLGDQPGAAAECATAHKLDPGDGLVAFYCACALSWCEDSKRVQELLRVCVDLPRSPSAIEIELDPHFAESIAG